MRNEEIENFYKNLTIKPDNFLSTSLNLNKFLKKFSGFKSETNIDDYVLNLIYDGFITEPSTFYNRRYKLIGKIH